MWVQPPRVGAIPTPTDKIKETIMSNATIPSLNKRQKIFADGVLAGLTLLVAYQRAGYAEGRTDKLTTQEAWKLSKRSNIQQYIGMIQEMSGETVRDAQAREAGLDANGINESVLTRVGMLMRYEAIANECNDMQAHDTQLKALDAICKVMGFNTPERLQVAQVSYVIDYGAAQLEDAADGLPVLEAPALRVALPIAPASEREREPDVPPPFEPYFDPADVIDAVPVMVAATESITVDDL